MGVGIPSVSEHDVVVLCTEVTCLQCLPGFVIVKFPQHKFVSFSPLSEFWWVRNLTHQSLIKGNSSVGFKSILLRGSTFFDQNREFLDAEKCQASNKPQFEKSSICINVLKQWLRHNQEPSSLFTACSLTRYIKKRSPATMPRGIWSRRSMTWFWYSALFDNCSTGSGRDSGVLNGCSRPQGWNMGGLISTRSPLDHTWSIPGADWWWCIKRPDGDSWLLRSHLSDLQRERERGGGGEREREREHVSKLRIA